MSAGNSQFSIPGSGHAFVRAVRTHWRSLTGGSAVRDAERRTLVACSGGADSAALVLALADRPIEVAHIVHDLRSEAEAIGDRDAVRDLADSLGLPFHEQKVCVRDRPGNLEANASTGRYEALREIAVGRGIGLVATAHHAEDQLETLLMRIARGSGVAGLSGIAPVRSEGSVQIVRPMLSVSRNDAQSFCRICGHAWREDATNADISRARAAIRHTVLPALIEAEPRVLTGAARTVRQMQLAKSVLENEAARVLSTADRVLNRCVWDRAALADEPVAVVGAALRAAADALLAGRHADTRGSDSVLAVSETICSRSATSARYDWRGLVVSVDSHCVSLERDNDE